MQSAKPQKEHEFLQSIVGEGRGKMPDGDMMTAIITVGFDPARNKFVGTWIGSMMSHLWVYRGWLDPYGKTLVLEEEGPRVDGGEGAAIYNDALILHDDNHRTFSGSIQ